MSASDATLKALHAVLAEQLLDMIQNGVPVFDKEGNEAGTRKATAAELAVAVTFLKNNEIPLTLMTAMPPRPCGKRWKRGVSGQSPSCPTSSLTQPYSKD